MPLFCILFIWPHQIYKRVVHVHVAYDHMHYLLQKEPQGKIEIINFVNLSNTIKRAVCAVHFTYIGAIFCQRKFQIYVLKIATGSGWITP